jgi:hypothetical protein
VYLAVLGQFDYLHEQRVEGGTVENFDEVLVSVLKEIHVSDLRASLEREEYEGRSVSVWLAEFYRAFCKHLARDVWVSPSVNHCFGGNALNFYIAEQEPHDEFMAVSRVPRKWAVEIRVVEDLEEGKRMNFRRHSLIDVADSTGYIHENPLKKRYPQAFSGLYALLDESVERVSIEFRFSEPAKRVPGVWYVVCGREFKEARLMRVKKEGEDEGSVKNGARENPRSNE